MLMLVALLGFAVALMHAFGYFTPDVGGRILGFAVTFLICCAAAFIHWARASGRIPYAIIENDDGNEVYLTREEFRRMGGDDHV